MVVLVLFVLLAVALLLLPRRSKRRGGDNSDYRASVLRAESLHASQTESGEAAQKLVFEKEGQEASSRRIGGEDDFIPYEYLKPLPRAYWSERPEALIPVAMEYVSSKGEKTSREVDIRTFYEGVSDDGKPDVYIDGFCHLRNSRRTFLASRATAITVIQTGEIFCDVSKFRDYLWSAYLASQEGALDAFFGSCGAEFSEIVLFIGRAEGRLKNRVKQILLAKLSELSGVPEQEIKASKVCRDVFKVVGFDSRDFKQAVKIFGEKVYENPSLYFALESVLSDISIDKKGSKDELVEAMARKTLKKVAPPPSL